MTLSEFLLARIDDDQAFAEVQIRLRDRAGKLSPAQESNAQGLAAAVMDLVLEDPQAIALIARDAEQGVSASIGTPDRVLRECEAKRRIVELVESKRLRANVTTSLVTILLHLASVYSDHPDFDPAWRV